MKKTLKDLEQEPVTPEVVKHRNVFLRFVDRLEAAFYVLVGWAEPTDTKLGYAVRTTIEKLTRQGTTFAKNKAEMLTVCSLITVKMLDESGSDNAVITHKEVSRSDKNIGDWEIVVRKIS